MGIDFWEAREPFRERRPISADYDRFSNRRRTPITKDSVAARNKGDVKVNMMKTRCAILPTSSPEVAVLPSNKTLISS